MGKVAVITGASKGIGYHCAYYFAKKGYSLALMSRNQDILEKMKDTMISEYQVDVSVHTVNVSDKANVTKAFQEAVEHHHHIDVLLNNAGVLHLGTELITEDHFNELIDVNLKGFFYVLQAVVPIMKQQKSGYIFNLGSRAGKRGLAKFGVYSMTKFGVVGMSEALFIDMAEYNVKVTALCPSVIDTDMTRQFEGIANQDKIDVGDIVSTIDYCLKLGPNACIKEIEIYCKPLIGMI